MYRRLLAITFTILILQSMVLELTVLEIHGSEGSNGLSIEYIGWYSSAGTPRVYPGSSRVNLLLEVRNNYNYSLSDLIGCLILPEGFNPSMGNGLCTEPVATNGSYLQIIPPNYVFQLRYLIDINDSISPGQYNISVKISYTVNSTYFEEYLSFNVTILEYPPLDIEVIDYYWEPEEIYPSTTSASLTILLKNNGESTISNGIVRLYLPEGFEPNKYVLTGLRLSPNEVYSLKFTDVDVKPSTSPGSYYGYLEINATTSTEDGVGYEGYWNSNIELVVSYPPEPSVEIIDTGFREKIVYNESMLVDIYVTIRNNGLPTITHVLAYLYLPSDARTLDNRSLSITIYEGQISYGDVVTLTFNNINITSSDNILENLVLKLDMIMNYRGARYNVSRTYSFTLNLTKYTNYLGLASIRWLYNGQPAVALPSSRNIEMQIVLVNYGPRTIKTMVPSIELPEGINLRDISLQSYGSIPSGEAATLSIKLDISDDLEPGSYLSKLTLNLIISSDNALLFTRQDITIPITVADPNDYIPVLDIVNAYWGRGSPQQVYPGERLVPLYIEVYNYGRYTASNVITVISSYNSSISIIEDTISLGDISPGELSIASYTLDLRNASQGILRFNIKINYVITIYGSYLRREFNKEIVVELQEFEGLLGKGLEIVSYSWTDQPVFPNTENVTYRINLINRNPFTIQGLNAILKLPKEFYGLYKNDTVETYVQGPIQSMQVFQIDFKITVGNVKPGLYNAKLYVDYVLATGGPSKRVLEEYNVLIHINDPKDSIAYIDSYWLYQSPEPGKYGQYLVIILRNNLFPSMNGIYAEIKLPDGIVFTHTNSSWGRLYPSYIGIQTTSLPSGVSKLWGLPIESIIQAPTQTSASKGDFIVFTIPVNIVDNISIGFYNTSLRLFFIDHTGNERSIDVIAKVGISGNIKYIDILLPRRIYVRDLVNDVNLTLKVSGYGNAYNTYLIIYPSIPIVVPSKSLYYLGNLKSGETRIINMSLYYNPLYTASAPSIIRYGTIPLIITLSYTDELGYTHFVNTSISLVLYPFIKLDIYDIKAVYRDGNVKITGTIMNIGSATAERIVACLIYGGTNASTFIGDLDPGSEATFSIETSSEYGGSSGFLEIVYIDSYDQYHKTRIPITIEYEKIIEVTETPKPIFGTTEYIVIGIVALFLAIAVYIIYRMMKQHERRLEKIRV